MAVFAVTYGNRDYEDSLLETKDLFESKGFVGLAGAVFVANTHLHQSWRTNRPNSDDLKIAYDFGVKIKDRLENLNDVNELKLEVPGNFPYVEKKSSTSSNGSRNRRHLCKLQNMCKTLPYICYKS